MYDIGSEASTQRSVQLIFILYSISLNHSISYFKSRYCNKITFKVPRIDSTSLRVRVVTIWFFPRVYNVEHFSWLTSYINIRFSRRQLLTGTTLDSLRNPRLTEVAQHFRDLFGFETTIVEQLGLHIEAYLLSSFESFIGTDLLIEYSAYFFQCC